MIDVRRLRTEPDYRAGIERKRVAPGLIDEVLAADEARRAALGEVEELRARQNAASKEIGRAAPDERPAKIAAAAALKDELAAKEPLLTEAEARFNELLIRVPNPAHPSVPDGGEEDY
ncbi:MAG TPA: serine--tRNA ligase, partial [Acidimicrobiia bacterium]|nr:serine--tRNA ligase [Acidimicrobiia bacterium]